MATDFTCGKDMPSDARTRVDCYADIDTLYLGYRAENSNSSYPGKIGLIRLYNKQLEENEMKTNVSYESSISRS